MSKVLTLLLTTLLLISNQARAIESNLFSSDYSSVTLISENSQIRPGEEFWLALKFEQTPNWHIYWQNPGDSGLPPKLEWEEHSDVMFDSEIHWERPDILAVDQLLNYGFSRETVLLPVKAYLKKDFNGTEVEIKLGADWLICKVDCVPESHTFILKLPVGPKITGEQAVYFSNSNKLRPSQGLYSGSYRKDESNIEINFNSLPKILGTPHLALVEQSISQNYIKQDFQDLTLNLKIAPENKNLPDTLHAVLLDVDQNNHTTDSYEIVLEKNNTGNATTNLNQSEALLASKNLPNQAKGNSETPAFITILIFAFLGGIILNLMPCVFPIISIKVLDFINLSSKDPRVARRHSLSFAAGIISLMLSLAILAEVLKLFGQNLGWGFQLQSPIFVSCLIILFYLLGLSFAGYFYVGDKLMSKTAAIQTEKSYFGSFLNGALATLVATPCTAPFMGTALGATIGLNFFLSLLIFLSLGIGISFPFVALTYNQKLMSLMPRPGAWMEKLKELMSFLMFFTCLWLLWVVVSLTSPEYLIGLLFTLIMLTVIIWVKDNFHYSNPYLKFIKSLIMIFLLVLAFSPLSTASNYQPNDDSSPKASNPYGINYQNYSEELLASELAAGNVVYVDFTARWCITCQVNKKRVFSSFEVRDFFQKNHVSLLVADWTNKDEKIKESLNKYGRNSVPLNIIYGNKDKSGDFRILPALLSASEVLNNLEELTLTDKEKNHVQN